ncbi:hypothetical protein R6Q57_000081 [Mikania cordata]
MPPQFYDILCETPNHGALSFCIGMKEEYSALWDVDTASIGIRASLYSFESRLSKGVGLRVAAIAAEAVV